MRHTFPPYKLTSKKDFYKLKSVYLASLSNREGKKLFLKSVLLVGLVIYRLSNTNGVDAQTFDYKAALTKSLLYFEGQRSGKLHPNQRVQWRGDSGLNDGKDAEFDLTGGYYDSGDNVKFGFPMAFTITMLSWSVIEYVEQLKSTNELTNALNAIKWGTDYLIKSHHDSTALYGQVGDGDTDHSCWERPEDMATPRTTFRIDADHPGSDLAAETAAAFAAASIALRSTYPEYADNLQHRADVLFEFAQVYTGLYQNSIPAAKFYASSGYGDELLWAAAWLYRATSNPNALGFLSEAKDRDGGGPRTDFSWDDKYLGAQILIAKILLDKKVKNDFPWTYYKSLGEKFICSCLQQNDNNVKKTPGGLLWFQSWNNLQYTTTATFLATVYSDYLASKNASMECRDGTVQPSELLSLARSQVNYILGGNPKNMSFMVGYGSNYPKQIHHRAASIVSIKEDPTLVTCKGGYDLWYNKNEPNPNVLDGAVVGGPDENDGYTDSRSNFKQAEPSTVTVAPLVGVLARLAAA